MAKPAEAFFLPRGAAVHPKTDKPYRYDAEAERSVPDPDGAFEIKVAVSAEDAEAIQKRIKDFAKAEGLKTVKNWPWSDEIDRDSGEPTGRVLFKAKQYGKTKEGKAKFIAHYDSAAAPLPKDFKLTSGSEILTQVRPRAYKTLGGGVSLSLLAIQVLRYVEYNRNPFKPQEDGEFRHEADEDEDEGNAPFKNEEEDNGSSSTDF
jgi:hypothetical protein